MAETSEAAFLERIRERLRERQALAVPHPGRLPFRTRPDRRGDRGAGTGGVGRARDGGPVTANQTAGNAALENDPQRLIAQFTRELEAVGGEAIRAENYAAAAQIVLEKCRTMGWRTLVRDRDARLDRLRLEGRTDDLGDAELSVRRPNGSGEGGPSIWEADMGLTWAEAGIAETGTIALLTAPDRSKRVSLVPVAHIAVLPAADLLATRGQFFRRLREDGQFPSSLTLVTGPSRTSDIENDKTIGVHGPRYEVVILVES